MFSFANVPQHHALCLVIIVVHPALLNYKKNITNRIEKDLFSLERR